MADFILGGFTTLITVFCTQLLIHFLSKSREKEGRKESFKLKLYELRLQAAQTAYQYVLRVYRAYRIPSRGVDSKQLNIEARDWLDGQALILGEKVYETVIFYFFAMDNPNLSDEEHAKELVKAEEALKSILKDLKE